MIEKQMHSTNKENKDISSQRSNKLTGICIDHSTFLALHSADDRKRNATKNFFIYHFHQNIHISYEQIGFIDNKIWKLSEDYQTLYFRFMDNFFSYFNIIRKPYSHKTFKYLKTDNSLSFSDNLVESFMMEHNLRLFSWIERRSNLKKALW